MRRVRPAVMRAAAMYAVLIAVAWCALFPILWGFSGSLKKQTEVGEPTLLPAHPQWSNYTEVFRLMPFGRMFANTV
jgi:multiple sugar transport system permease protein